MKCDNCNKEHHLHELDYYTDGRSPVLLCPSCSPRRLKETSQKQRSAK